MKEFWNYFSNIEHIGKYSWAAVILRNNNSEIILGKFPLAEIEEEEEEEIAYFTVRWKTRASFVYRAKNIR